jgi:hypothetical protein
MQDMSDLRKSIAERLGSAAKSERPGAKAKFGFKVGDRVAYKPYPAKTAGELVEIRKPTRLEGVEMQYGIKQASGAIMWVPEGMVVRASRPGAKAKMAADPALASFLKKWKRNEADNYHSENVVMLAKFVGASGDVAEANRIMQQHDEMGHLTPELNSKRYALYTALKAKLLAKYPGVTFSRPGAKAKFMTNAGFAFLQKMLREYASMKGTRWYNEAEEIRDNSTEYTDADVIAAVGNLKAKSVSSRPGAKAKFAEDAREVAQEILRQLGGGRFMAMVGGKNAFHGTFGGKPGLQIDIGKGAEGGINRLIVKLDRGSDTYDMEFWRVAKRGMDVKKVSEASGVYADDLQRIFTSRTKFYTSLSRPGAKAKMAYQPSEADWKKWLKGWTLRMPQVSDAGIRHFNSFEEAKRYADEKCGGFACVISHDGQRVASKSALAGATGSWTKHSRPGAKGSSKAKA